MSTADPASASAALVFAALGDATRLSLVVRLADGRALSIAALAAETRLTRQAVTKHLHVLRDAGLVAAARSGRETRFALRGAGVAQARATLDMVARRWDGALERLRAFVDG